MSETQTECAAFHRSIVLILCKTLAAIVFMVSAAVLAHTAMEGRPVRVEVLGTCNVAGCSELSAFCPRHAR